MAEPSHDVAPGLFVDQRTDGPGVDRLDPNDPAAPMYRLLARIRTPTTLRDTMIMPVRLGYAGQAPLEGAADALPKWDNLFPHVTVTEIRVPTPDGPARCQVYRPAAAGSGWPLIVYAHGGGFMVGRSEDTDYMARRICADNNAVIVSVNFRLAPEWPFPAGLDDCLAVYAWLRTHGGELGGDPTRIGVAGDSAGGNFAAALPLRAKDRGMVSPDVAVMFAPVLDLRFEEHESFNRLAPRGVVYDAAFMGFLRGAYCAYAEWEHPHVSPLRGDLRGYPPAMIFVGTHDPMVDSCAAFARKARAAGSVHVDLFVREGMPHGFYFWPGLFKAEGEPYAALKGFLARHLGTTA